MKPTSPFRVVNLRPYMAVNLPPCMKVMVRRLASMEFLAGITGGVVGCLGLIWFVYQFNAQWIFGGSKFAAFMAFGIMLTAGSVLAQLMVASIGWQDAPMVQLYRAYKNGERPPSVVFGVAVAILLFTVLANTVAVYLIYLMSL